MGVIGAGCYVGMSVKLKFDLTCQHTRCRCRSPPRPPGSCQCSTPSPPCMSRRWRDKLQQISKLSYQTSHSTGTHQCVPFFQLVLPSQFPVSLGWPWHGLLPPVWCLTLVHVPWPQVAEQSPQLSQLDHVPSTEMAIMVYPANNKTHCKFFHHKIKQGQEITSIWTFHTCTVCFTGDHPCRRSSTSICTFAPACVVSGWVPGPGHDPRCHKGVVCAGGVLRFAKGLATSQIEHFLVGNSIVQIISSVICFQLNGTGCLGWKVWTVLCTCHIMVTIFFWLSIASKR